MTTVNPTILAAYRMFATWHDTVRGAGFAPLGKPLSAYRALRAVVIGNPKLYMQDGEGYALNRAEAALSEWCAGNDSVRAHCQPLLDQVRTELAQPAEFDGRWTPESARRRVGGTFGT